MERWRRRTFVIRGLGQVKHARLVDPNDDQEDADRDSKIQWARPRPQAIGVIDEWMGKSHSDTAPMLVHDSRRVRRKSEPLARRANFAVVSMIRFPKTGGGSCSSGVHGTQ